MQLKASLQTAIEITDMLIGQGSKLKIALENDYHTRRVQKDYDANKDMQTHYVVPYATWSTQCLQDLEGVITSNRPLAKFRDSHTVTIDNAELLFAAWDKRLAILNEICDNLESLKKTPLVYSKQQCEISFQGEACKLKQGSNQATLCDYMFQFPLEEWKEFEDVYSYLTGEDIEESHRWPKNWETKIINAYDGINGHTNKKFRFPILKIENKSIKLTIPNRFKSE